MVNINAILAEAEAARIKRGDLTDMERVVALESYLPSDAEKQALADKYTKALRKRDDARPLRPIQGYLLETLSRALQQPNIGLLANAAVGSGKTLFIMLASTLAQWQSGIERVLILVHPDMVQQLRDDMYEWGQEYYIRQDVEIMSYNQLSVAREQDILPRLFDGQPPQLILADEIQALRYDSTSRGRKFRRFFQQFPECRLVGLSGTLSSASVMDYWHLARYALRQYSPLPLKKEIAESWARVLDKDGKPADKDWAEAWPLTHHFTGHRGGQPFEDTANPSHVKQVRLAYQKRFLSSPFTVGTLAPACSAPLNITGVRQPVPPVVAEALRNLMDTWDRPDGEELADGASVARCAKQLSLGFYYRWDWPGEPDEEWLDARSLWNSSVRWYLQRFAREGCDTAMQVEQYIRSTMHDKAGGMLRTEERKRGNKNNLGKAPTMAEALRAWDEQRDKPPPPTKAVWLDTSIMAWALQWAHRTQGVLWFQSIAVGEMLDALGLGVYRTSTPSPERIKSGPVAVGWITNHKGKNQFYKAGSSRSLVLEPPGSKAGAQQWEQMLGRQHRGSRTEPVYIEVVQGTWTQQLAMQQALHGATFQEDTTGQPQKLLLATRRGLRSTHQ